MCDLKQSLSESMASYINMASYTYFPKPNGETLNKFLKVNSVLKVHVLSPSRILCVC